MNGVHAWRAVGAFLNPDFPLTNDRAPRRSRSNYTCEIMFLRRSGSIGVLPLPITGSQCGRRFVEEG